MEIGSRLKEAREARGLTLEAVEEETKIRRKYLKALEEEQFQVLPGPIYAKAFLKSYAKFLKLDLEESLEAYNRYFTPETAQENALEQEEAMRPVAPEKPRSWRYLIVAAVGLALVVTVYYGALGGGNGRPAKQAGDGVVKTGEPANPPNQSLDQTPAPAGQPQGGEPLPPAVDPGVNMVLNVKDNRSWVQVIVDDNPAFQGFLNAGQSKNFAAKDKIFVRLGDAGVVEVQVNGENLGTLGGHGEVVNREFTSLPRG